MSDDHEDWFHTQRAHPNVGRRRRRNDKQVHGCRRRRNVREHDPHWYLVRSWRGLHITLCLCVFVFACQFVCCE